MAGLSGERRDHLLKRVREARQLAEAAYSERLKLLGIWASCSRSHAHSYDCHVVARDQLALGAEEARLRLAIEAALEREAVGAPAGANAGERAAISVARFISGSAFTLLNRMSALRAMEVRGLIDETVARRRQYGGRSLREYRIAQANPRLAPDAVLERALRDAFAEASEEVGAVFDPADPYGLLLPEPKSLRELHRILGEEVTEDDWRADDVLGWVYQYYQDEARQSFRAGRGRGERHAADAGQMAAINCLYTPHWVVRLLVDNTLGRLLLEHQGRLAEATTRLWDEGELRSQGGETVLEQCRFLEPGAAAAEVPTTKPLRELKVLDPACGSGHFLVYAFDVLWRAYRQAEPGTPPEEHAAAILEHNLFGIDIDLRACQLAALGLYLKAKSYAPAFRPRTVNVVCADVRVLDGERTKAFLGGLRDDPALQGIARRLLSDLGSTGEIGSLLRVREPFEGLLRLRKATDEVEHSQADVVEAPRLQGIIKDRATSEILAALRDFEQDAVERSDMGGQLFASEAERSLGLLSLLSQRYDVVLMNPPYNKRQELPDVTRAYLAEHFNRTQGNIYAAFIEQAVDLAAPGGFVGMLTPMGYLYLRTMRKLRTDVLAEQAPPELVVEFSWGILDPAQVQTAAAVLRKAGGQGADKRRPRVFWDLTAPKGGLAKEAAFISGLARLRRGENVPERYQASLGQLSLVPGSPYAYWAPEELREAFAKLSPLDRDNAHNATAEKVADVKQGLATADDARFTRRWWEVPAEQVGQGKRWVPFVKGENYARWHHDPSLVVLWDNDGEELRAFERSVIRNAGFYFREGLSWQRVNANRRARTRYLPPGCIFADKGPSVFPAGLHRASAFSLLGILNSSLANLAMLMLTPERGWEVGQVSLLPIAAQAQQSECLAKAAREAHDLLVAWDTGRETSSRFVAPRLAQLALQVPQAPTTGHPLAEGFTWPMSPAWADIAALKGSRETSLAELLSLLNRRRQRLAMRVSELEAEVDGEVFRCYRLEGQAAAITSALQRRLGATVEEEEGAAHDAEEAEGPDETEAVGGSGDDTEEVAQLLSWYVKRVVDASASAIVPVVPPTGGGLLASVRELLRADWGEKRAWQLEDEVHDILGCSLEEWLVHEFFPFHVRLYRNRPVFWLLWSAPSLRGRGRKEPALACLLDYRRLTRDTLLLVRGKLVAGALDDLRADAERLEREATEARLGGGSSAAQRRQAAQEARAKVVGLEVFDQALAAVLGQRPRSSPAEGGSWVARKVAQLSEDGYSPDQDLGVLVNISPLRDAGVLHPAAEKVR
jgi:Arc/MetJ family transcription regulator